MNMGLVVFVEVVLLLLLFAGEKSQFVTLLRKRTKLSVCAEGLGLRAVMLFDNEVKARSKKLIVGGWV